MRKEYWAAKVGKDLAAEAWNRVDNKQVTSSSTGYYQRVRKLFAAYYGVSMDADTYGLTPGGEMGETTLIYFNKIRQLVQHLLAMLTSKRIVFSASPRDTSAEAAQSASKAEGYLNAEVRALRLLRRATECFEHAFIGNEAHMFVLWNPKLGEEVGVDEMGEPIHEGRNEVKVYSVFDITRDESAPAGLRQWIITRDWANKYDLMAEYPEMASDIDGVDTSQTLPYYQGIWRRSYNSVESDLIPVYTFYHERTPAVPEGRMCKFLNASVYLTCGPLPYPKIPGFRLSPSDILSTELGYSPANDLLVLQDAVNLLKSVAITNEATFGVQSLQTRPGSLVNKQSLGTGLNLFVTNSPIEPVQKTETPAEVFNNAAVIESDMEKILGLNAFSLGNVDPSSRLSTQSIAMMKQSTMEFSSGPQKAYIAFLEDVATQLVRNMQLNAIEPRFMQMQPEGGKPSIESISAADLAGVDKITIDTGNELLETASNRFYASELLTQHGVIQDVPTYVRFLRDGNINNALEDKFNESVSISRKRELIMQGTPPPVFITDDHVLHVRAYKAIMDMPEVEKNPQIIQLIQQQIMQHIELAKQTPPELSAMLGHTPLGLPAPAQGQEAGAPPPEGGPAPEEQAA